MNEKKHLQLHLNLKKARKNCINMKDRERREIKLTFRELSITKNTIGVTNNPFGEIVGSRVHKY